MDAVSTNAPDAKTPMRILYLIGGYGQAHMGGLIHREMALAVREAGHDYQVFSASSTAAADPFDEGLVVHRPPGDALRRGVGRLLRPLLREPGLLDAVSKLAGVLQERGPFDVIFAEGAYPMGVVAWRATRRLLTPYVVSVIGGDFLANEKAGYGYARHALPRMLMRMALRGAAAVRAISAYAGAGAVRLGSPPEKIALVQRNIASTAFPPEGLDLASFRASSRRRVAARLGLDQAPLVVSAGRLLPIKGFDVLVRALAAVPRPRAHLLLLGPDRTGAGERSYRDSLHRLARTLGAADRLQFTDAVPLEDVREFLAAADVVAIPSLEEGGNKVLVEAAAVGTPVVASRTAGNAEWAARWRCALTVEPGSPEALASGLAAVLADEALARSMGTNAPEFAEQFRTPVVARRIVRLCLHATRGGAVPADLREPEELRAPAGGKALA